MELGSVENRLKLLKTQQKALRRLTRTQKDAVLLALAAQLREQAAVLLSVNHHDVAVFSAATPNSPLLDRLTLTESRIAAMACTLEAIAAQPDPVGEILESRDLPSGIRLAKLREPIGTILLIFESRPNVAIEAFALAWKSGNALILKGGKEALATLEFMGRLITSVLPLDIAPVWMLDATDRSTLEPLLQAKRYIDVVIPRGGESLIEWVSERAQMPVLKNDRGLCHLYIHHDADLDMALRILINAKLQRPTVCNATETLLIDHAIAEPFLAQVAAITDLQLHAEPEAFAILQRAGATSLHPAQTDTFHREYLDRALSVRIVSGFEAAVLHIMTHSSGHSESIVTRSRETAQAFQEQINSAVTYWNTSTRFTDGFEFGMGGEIGISTGKLHVRGPIGLIELTQTRWIGEAIDQQQGAIRR